MNDIQIMGIVGGLAMNHPSIMSMVSQLNSIWQAHQAELMRVNNEYLVAAQKSTGMIDQAGIVLQIMKLHPDLVPLIVQVLGIVAPHIPETQQTLVQLQTQAMQL